jgi:hypothetical protein
MYLFFVGLLYLAANLEAKSSLIVMSVPDKKKRPNEWPFQCMLTI